MTVTSWLIILISIFSCNVFAADSLSYSGRIVNANGSPVTGPVNLQFKLSYTDAPTVAICNKTINNVPLSNGVFHAKLDFTVAECGGTLSLLQVLSATPLNESVAIQLTDLSHSKTYSYQAVHSVPTSLVSSVAKTLDQMGAANGEYLKWNGTKWIPGAAGTGSGSVTQIDTGTGLSGGPITGTGTISIANLGVDTAQLANSAVTDAKVATGAGIARSKLATGTPNYVLVNDVSGVMTGVATLPLAQGGTGASTVPGVWTVLGLGSAAGLDVGNNVGNVMAADSVPSCFAFEKLQMSLAPFQWTCVTDANTDTTKLPLAGGTMAGDIDMDGNQILNLSAPIVGSDAANKTYVDTAVSGSAVWAVATGNTYRLTGNVGVGTATPARNIEVVNSDADEALRITRAANASDEATIGFVPSGASSTTNPSWKMGLPVNSNNFSLTSFDGSTTTNVLLLSPVGMVIPRLTTTERNAVVSPANGLQIYNTTTNEINFYNGSTWNALGVAGAGVTSLVAGTGLTGGTISSSGTIAVDVGTGPNKIVQLNGSSQLPAVDGSALTNLTPANLSAPVPINKGGTGLSANGAGNTLVGMNNAGTAMEYKAISGTGVTVTNGAGTMNFAVTGAPPIGAASGDLSGTYPSPNVVALQGTPVSAGPASGNILLYNGTSYAPTAISGDATISSTGAVTLATVPVSKGGTGVTSLTAKGIVSVNAGGTGLVSTVCANLEVLSFNASGDAVCSPISSLVSTSFIQNGNSFGAGAVLGTNDNNSLNFETNATTKMTILSSGFVGIGTATPAEKLTIEDNNGVPGTNIFGVKNTNAAGSGQFGIRNNGTGVISVQATGSSYAGMPALYNKGSIGVSGNLTALQFGTNGDLPSGGTAPIHFTAGGYTNSPTMTVTPGNPGNVGIGTTSPATILDVRINSGATSDIGTFVNNDANFGANLRIGQNSTTKNMGFGWFGSGQTAYRSLIPNTAYIFGNTGASQVALNSMGTAPLIFATNDWNERMRIDSTGKVGIGTTTPDQTLTVSGRISVQNGGTTLGVFGANSDNQNTSFSRNAFESAGVWNRINTGQYSVLNQLQGLAGLSEFQVYTSAPAANPIANWVKQFSVKSDGTGFFAGNVGINNSAPVQKLQVKGAIAYETDNSTNYVSIKAPNSLAGTYSLTLPSTLGLSGQVLTTDAAGVLSWSTAATTASTVGGDLTGTIANAQIAADAVGTTEIANGSVTYAKMSLANGEIPFAKIASFTTTNVPEGTNYYFTDARVSAALMSSYATGTAIPLATTDTLNQALGKLEAQIIANSTAVGGMWNKTGSFVYYNGGNVGIGTTTPADKLHVVGGGTFSSGLGNISIVPDYSGIGVIQSYQGTGVFRPLQIDGLGVKINGKGSPISLMDGNVGIGTSTPTAPFEVIKSGANDPIARFGSTGATDPQKLAVVNGSGSTSLAVSGGPGQFTPGSAVGDSIFLTGGGKLLFSNAGTRTDMVINGSGDVGIGTTNPVDKLEVSGDIRLGTAAEGYLTSKRSGQILIGEDASAVLINAGNSGVGAAVPMYIGRANTDMIFSNDNNQERMRIATGGNVGIGIPTPSEKLEVNGNAKATAFLYTSDKRLKKDIKPIKNSIEKVIALNGVEFIWRKTGESETGLIAQDVEKVVPNLVETSSVDGMKSVKYGNIVALLIESTKEQQAQAIKAQREIASLKEENKKLKADIELIKKHLKIK